jgi:hypothetical protein
MTPFSGARDDDANPVSRHASSWAWKQVFWTRENAPKFVKAEAFKTAEAVSAGRPAS